MKKVFGKTSQNSRVSMGSCDPEVFFKKVFLKIFQILYKNIFAGVSY